MNSTLGENGWRLYNAASGRKAAVPMQFVGLLLIVNSLIGGAWWVTSGRPQMVVVPICVAAMTAGVFLIIHDRSTPAENRGGTGTATVVPGSDELAKQMTEAKAVLADLQDQTAAADWHLKQLDDHIKNMEILPDGRTRIGNTVTGQAAVLISKLEALQKVPADRPADALPIAKECISLYESTRDHLKGAVLVGGDIGPETTGWLYVTAATTAQRMGDHDRALEWARTAVAVRSTPDRQFLLVTALINRNLSGEATQIIQQQLKAGGPDAVKFRQYLDQFKIPYK